MCHLHNIVFLKWAGTMGALAFHIQENTNLCFCQTLLDSNLVLSSNFLLAYWEFQHFSICFNCQ